MAQALTMEDRHVRFFYENAGWSYDPKIETSEQGRVSCAIALATAERHAFGHDGAGWFTEWHPDPYGCIGCDCGSDDCDCSTGAPHEVYVCLLKVGDEVIGSLGGICSPSDAYRRVVEAELALDAMERK